jgi:hypothetical protein
MATKKLVLAGSEQQPIGRDIDSIISGLTQYSTERGPESQQHGWPQVKLSGISGSLEESSLSK